MNGLFAHRSLGTLLTTAAFAAALAVPAVHAAIERLDDSASPRSRVPAQVSGDRSGRAPTANVGTSIVRVRFGEVDYRLATTRFVGRRARIYYVVPAQIRGLLSPAGLRVEWRGLGAFGSGVARPGDRVPVWTGIVRAPWMDESLDLSMQLDLRQVRMPGNADFGLESYFEIETLP